MLGSGLGAQTEHPQLRAAQSHPVSFISERKVLFQVLQEMLSAEAIYRLLLDYVFPRYLHDGIRIRTQPCCVTGWQHRIYFTDPRGGPEMVIDWSLVTQQVVLSYHI